jgi:hypothetical protein
MPASTRSIRLKVVPANKKAYGIESEFGNARKVFTNLAGIEKTPHRRGGSSRPVIDTDRESRVARARQVRSSPI